MAKPAPVAIPTEPIGSIPRPLDLIERVAKGDSEDPNLEPLYEDAIRDNSLIEAQRGCSASQPYGGAWLA